jgi:hypothetical protein
VIKKMAEMIIKIELIELINSIKNKLDNVGINKAEVLISQLKNDNISSSTMSRIEAEIDELCFNNNDYE